MKKDEKDVKAIRRRINTIRQSISAMDLVCPGTLYERKKKCGRPNCRCATDPEALHGPYYEWNKREGGRLVHKIVSPEQAEEIKKAIENYRKIEALMKQWGCETASIILRDK